MEPQGQLKSTVLASGVTKRSTHLNDGRELIYYDDKGSKLPETRRSDSRELDPRPQTATMRLDVLTNEWISVASARQNRAFLPPKEFDPLAPQSETNPSEIPDYYDVAVFENRSPSFGPVQDSGQVDQVPFKVGQTHPSFGRCEVVCFSPETEGSFATLPANRARTVIEAWADRTAELAKLPGIKQVFCFENRGEEIGVTLHHPHGQIYGYPYITPRTQALLRSLELYGPGLFEDILTNQADSERNLITGEYFSAYIPFAARWPLEVHIMAHRQVPDLSSLEEAERAELTTIYQRILRAFDALYDDRTGYIAAWHQAPVVTGRDQVRLTCQITSPRRAANKLKYLAGSEAAMGAFIGDVPPETQAAQFKAALARCEG